MEVDILDIENEINDLDCSKKGTFKNIPPKCLKGAIDVCGPVLLKIWNEVIISQSSYPQNLKLADVTPVFKKENPLEAKNYRPISVLPTVTKIFERLIQKQTLDYISQFLSPLLCGYRKGFNTQTALLHLIEKCKIMLDKNGFAAAILMDLSKAFDTINHELLISKLHAYGFDKSSLNLVLSYLKDRKQRVKINTTFSPWVELGCGVPQGSVLGPMLFDIYLNDLFLFLSATDICNFADDTTLFECNENIEKVIQKLESSSELVILWFENNFMKVNTEKCHFLVSGQKHEHLWTKVGENIIWEKNEVKLLGLTIDNDLKFDTHISKICSKANQKLSILTRMKTFLSFKQRRIIFKSFFESQFKYCPLIWMFCSRTANGKINKLHERALRIVYDDLESSFEELLEKDNSFNIHHQNVQRVALEMYKILHGLSEGSFNEILTDLKKNNHYNLRSASEFLVPSVNSEYKGKNSLRYFGPIIWYSLNSDIKNIDTLSKFKEKIRKWKPDNCPCRLCKEFITGVGFL